MEKPNSDEEEETICKCFQVSESVIRAYIADNEVTEIKEVTEGCEAGGNCQSCHILIQLFIDEYQEELEPEQPPELVDSGKKENKKGFFGKLFSKD